MKRRSFIKHTAGAAVTLPFALQGVRLSALPRSAFFGSIANDTDRVLVIIRLNGGNDGLNMLVPMDQYDQLFNARQAVLLPEDSILSLTAENGLHPKMSGIRDLFTDGLVGFVQDVGYPNQNRSHFRSTDIWSTGSPADEFWTTGWMGRYFDQRYDGYPDGYPNDEHPHPFAITMGNTVSTTCQGEVANYSIALRDPFSLTQLAEDSETMVPDTPYGDELQYIRNIIAQTNAYGEAVMEAANMGNNMATYPIGNRLASQLKNVALLMSGGLQTRIYIVSIGGFDTHANQVIKSDPTEGRHARLLKNISEAVTAFMNDIQQLGLASRVLGMTFSEFGRQIRSNDSLGTDHGTAAPLILFGESACANVIGQNPTIPDDVSPQDGVPMQYDFRDVYGSVLMDWFGVSEDEIRGSLYDEFMYLPVLGDDCDQVTTNTQNLLNEQVEASAFPNPFRNWATVSLKHTGGWLKVSVFDSVGKEVKVLTNQNLSAGSYQFRLEGHDLPPGNYYFRLVMQGGAQKTIHIVRA